MAVATTNDIERVLAAISDLKAALVKPVPVPDPMPGGGAGPISVRVGFRGNPPLHVGETGILHGTCEGFDPRGISLWIDPDGEVIETVGVEVLTNETIDRGKYTTYNVLARWVPRKEYEAGSYLEFVTGIPEPESKTLAVKITAAPKPQPKPAVTDGSRWQPVTEEQYHAADKLPVCRDNTEVDLALERCRFGRLPWINSLASAEEARALGLAATAVVSYVALSEGLAEHARVLSLDRTQRAKHWSYLFRIDDDLMGAIHCLGGVPGTLLPDWRSPYGEGLSSAGTVAQLAGKSFAAWLKGAWNPGTGGGPSGE